MSKRSSDFMCSGSQDKTLKIWDFGSVITQYNKQNRKIDEEITCKALITTKAHDMEINSIAISPNDQIIASASRDKLVKLWNKDKLTLISVLRGHKRGVWCVQFSPIDRCIASSSADKTIKIWSLTDYSCLRSFEGHTGSVLKFSFVTRGMQLLSSGSDGLIKLWTIKTNECVNTFEHHDDKVWALSTLHDGDQFISGDGDCMITFWNDTTEIEKEEEQKNREIQLLQEQELSNLLYDKKYREAIQIAFKLEQPYKIRSIFSTLLESTDDEQTNIDNLSLLNDIISDFNDDSLEKCISYIRDWNTIARHSYIAQDILNLIVRTFSPSKLMELPNMKVLLQALIPYTDRHYQRLDLLLQKSCIIDFTLQRMNILTPIPEDDDISLANNKKIEIIEDTTSDSDGDDDNDENMDDIHFDESSKLNLVQSPAKRKSIQNEESNKGEPPVKKRKLGSDESDVKLQKKSLSPKKTPQPSPHRAKLMAKKRLLARAQKSKNK